MAIIWHDIKPYQPSALWIICLGLNHPWASVLLLIKTSFYVFVNSIQGSIQKKFAFTTAIL